VKSINYGMMSELNTMFLRHLKVLTKIMTKQYKIDFKQMCAEDCCQTRELTNEQRITSRELFRNMLNFAPEDRPAIQEVKEHPALWNGSKKIDQIMVWN